MAKTPPFPGKKAHQAPRVDGIIAVQHPTRQDPSSSEGGRYHRAIRHPTRQELPSPHGIGGWASHLIRGWQPSKTQKTTDVVANKVTADEANRRSGGVQEPEAGRKTRRGARPLPRRTHLRGCIEHERKVRSAPTRTDAKWHAHFTPLPTQAIQVIATHTSRLWRKPQRASRTRAKASRPSNATEWAQDLKDDCCVAPRVGDPIVYPIINQENKGREPRTGPRRCCEGVLILIGIVLPATPIVP